MPIYEYECQKCGSQFEVVQKITAKPLIRCEKQKCKGKLLRLISNSSFVLKGSGWYVTDYPSEARKNALSGENKATEPKKDSNNKSSESKSANKAKKPSETKASQKKESSTH